MRETVHVLITTYTEPAATVRECVLRLLVAPEPLYMEKMIYVCDDGHAKAEGPKKKEMVEELRLLGTHIASNGSSSTLQIPVVRKGRFHVKRSLPDLCMMYVL